MPRISKEDIENALLALRKRKTFTVENVVSRLGCSIPTVRLKLRQWRALTSYNQSGQYYALPDVPRFDENGLWWFKGAYFSKFGTLKNTVVHLVGASSAGLTGDQIGELVGLRPRSFLHHFRDAKGIHREKHQGVYVYFSKECARYEVQRNARLEAIAKSEELNDGDVVVVLVALINHTDVKLETLALLPEVRAKGISTAAIERFLNRHGLKKTLRSRP